MTPPGRVARAYLALFVALYALQGVVAAYFFTFNPLYLRNAGVAASRAADVQSLALLPFMLKFLAGPLSDRFSLAGLGHRKPYIVLGLLLQAVGLIGLALVEPRGQLAWFTALAVLTVMGLGLYDTCCDGMVIDATPPADRDRVQGMLVAARALAAMICSSGFGLWLEQGRSVERAGYPALLWACAALSLFPLVQAVWLPEPARSPLAERFEWSALKVLVQPNSIRLLIFGAVYAVIAYGVEINLSPYYHALGFKHAAIGVLGSTRYVGRAAGGLLLGGIASHLGRRRALGVGVLLLALTTAAQGAAAGTLTAALAAFAFGAANGWVDALFFVLAMEAADPRMAASTYALFMAVTNVSVTGGSLFERLDAQVERVLGDRYRPTFLVAALALPPLLLLVPHLSRGGRSGEPERRDVALDDPAGAEKTRGPRE